MCLPAVKVPSLSLIAYASLCVYVDGQASSACRQTRPYLWLQHRVVVVVVVCGRTRRCWLSPSLSEHFQQTTYLSYFIFFSITNNIFYIFSSNCCSRLLKGYGGERNLLHLRERDVCFDDCQIFFGISDEIGSLLEHLPLSKGQIFGIGERNR